MADLGGGGAQPARAPPFEKNSINAPPPLFVHVPPPPFWNLKKKKKKKKKKGLIQPGYTPVATLPPPPPDVDGAPEKRVGGGGARPRNVPTKKIYVPKLRERAPQKNTFSGLNYICIHMQSVQLSSFNYLWYGAINDIILTKH